MTIYSLDSFSYLEPVCCSMSSSNCCFLTCIQIFQEKGQGVWYSHLFQNFLEFIVIHTVKGFGIVKKAREFQKNIYFCFIDYAKAFDCVDHNKLWKILKEIGIPEYLTCLLRNLYAGQEATVRTGHETTHWFQIGKGVKAVYCHPAYLTYMQSTSGECQAG